MIRQVVVTLLLFFLFCKNGVAQKNDNGFQHFISLRTNLLSFAEPNAGVMIGARYQWSKNFSTTLDPTLIFFNPYINLNGNRFHPFGIKIRWDMRYHFKKLFFAPELHFKKVTTRKWNTFGINCIGQNCDFYQRDIYRDQKTEIGASLKMGVDLPLDDKDRFSLEIYGGLGFKVYYYKTKSIPLGGSFFPTEPTDRNILGITEGNAVPMLPASFKLCYKLR